MQIRTTRTCSASFTGEGAAGRETNSPLLATCVRRQAELLMVGRASRQQPVRPETRDRFHQVLVLSYLLQTCRTDGEARACLDQLGQRPDGIGAAARQLQRLRLAAE